MVKLKHAERRQIEKFLGMEGGYVLDFSNLTFQEFFEDELQIDIYSDDFSGGGNSKANRLRTFLDKASPREAAKLLRALSNYQATYTPAPDEVYVDPEINGYKLSFANSFEDVISEIERRQSSGSTEDVIRIASQYDFDTVLDEVERARSFVDDDPEDAITAACSLVESVCRSILVELNLTLPRDLSVAPLYRAVREPLGLSPSREVADSTRADDVRTILASLSNTVGGIGALRTHAGDAHGREKGTKRVDARIARLAVNSASALAVFLIESWERNYPSRELRNADAKDRQP